MMYPLIRSLLFRLDPENSHDLALRLLALTAKFPSVQQPAHPISMPDQSTLAMGIRFPNPIGLAAGLDKQGTAREIFRRLGFGFVEVGTVTPKPQTGNTKPRLFRLVEHQALINRMGFNSVGLEQFKKNLEKTPVNIITGINIGKNATTPIHKSIDDYLICLQEVYSLADYITINISSPNTEGLRQLQDRELLDTLLANLDRSREDLADKTGNRKPLVVKIAPDLDASEIKTIAKLIRTHSIDGIIATNTTISRPGLENYPLATQKGGLSGAPLNQSSTRTVKLLYHNLQDEIPIIGVGGIHDPESALEKFEAGARLIQIYTGLIYSGPVLVKQILNTIQKNHRI
ncbi:MAG: quinone-dependent dihydroorotate dehydrogenase [Gammaproteobacteria bacterium]|nr:quinone-dependent dihydroorotate dehydrogenase [Gammaproteobacteria bacterium]MCY4275002.1 quinone-dependent dihydroorotate dehydrogenase [Gammaproteobacteria bacterium]